MRQGSLAARLFVVSALWNLAVLAIAGIVLSSLYRDTVERAFDARLHIYLKSIVAGVAAASDDHDFNLGNLGEPRFDLPLSGWYWQIRPVGTGQGETANSPSLWDQTLPSLKDLGIAETRGFTREAYVTGPGDQRLRMIERRIDFGVGVAYVMSVAADADEIEKDISSFQRTLITVLAILGFGVVASTSITVRVGLNPLRQMSQALAAIRSGSAQRLVGTFPKEITPLADELNALIDANHHIVERARTHVGNLAHALKTPLSVITNEARANNDQSWRKVGEQAIVMNEQIQHHLQRARAAARIATANDTTLVLPVIDGIERAMSRIYQARQIRLTVNLPHDLSFRGETQDLQDMLGNLVDNACKWAVAHVMIEAWQEPNKTLRFVIDDDGPGMAPEKRAEAMKRGQRLDESLPGSGLGLAIVGDLAELYGGRFTLSTSPQGGLRSELYLPSA